MKLQNTFIKYTFTKYLKVIKRDTSNFTIRYNLRFVKKRKIEASMTLLFLFQTAKNSTSGNSGYYVGGSSTLPRGGQLMRAYSPAASSVVGGPNATPTQPKPLATPGTRISAIIVTRL